jgi:hypothetical protein
MFVLNAQMAKNVVAVSLIENKSLKKCVFHYLIGFEL